MSLTSAFSITLSGLKNSQNALRYISQNVTNVNTPGYVRKDYNSQSVTAGGDPAGVTASVSRTVDTILEQSIRSNASDIRYYDTKESLLKTIQNIMGSPNSSIQIADALSEAMSSFTDMVATPGNTASNMDALSKWSTWGQQVDRMADEIQNVRADADRQMGEQINQVNNLVDQVYDLNQKIVQAQHTGGDASSLSEQRDQMLKSLSGYMDIKVTNNSDGSAHVYAGNGIPLVTQGKSHLSYNQAGTVNADSTFNTIDVVSVNPSTGATSATNMTLDGSISSGSIRGLLDMRDNELPAMAEEIGNMAGVIRDEVNKLSNRYSAVPAPNSLSGSNTGLLATDPHGFGNGVVTFAVTDSNNNLVSKVDVDMSTVTTMQDVMNAVNTGLGGAGTMSLTNGSLSLTAGSSSNGVVISQDTGTTPVASRGGKEFSHFFGMNNMLSNAGETNFDSGFSGTSAHGFAGGQTLQLEIRDDNNRVVSSMTYTTTAGQTFDDIINGINGGAGTLGSEITSMSLDSNGQLQTTLANSDYKLVVVDDQTNRGGTGKTLSDMIGMGDVQETKQAQGMTVSSAMNNDASRLPYASFDTSAAVGASALGPGDTSGITAYQDLVDTSVTFPKAGDIPQSTTTLSGYTGLVLQDMSSKASSASDSKTSAETLGTQMETLWSDKSGVNLDEEMANMIAWQNAYSASGKVLATLKEMMDELLQLA